MQHPLISIDQLIRDSWDVTKADWRKTLRYTLLPIVITTCLNLLFAGLGFLFKELENNLWYSVLSMIPSWVITAWFTVRLYKYVLKRDHGQQPTSTDTHVSVKELAILFLIVALMVIVTTAGTILFIIPGIWIGTLISFSVFLFLEDHKTGVSALKASKALVQGRWWATFGRRVVPGLVSSAAAMAAMFIFVFGALIASAILFGIGYALQLVITAALFDKILMAIGVIWLILLLIALIVGGLLLSVCATLFNAVVSAKLFHALKQTPIEPAREIVTATTQN